jgi:hypothetical protein
MATYLPPGWPAGVHPPGSQDFERTAVTWLLDAVPPDYRLYGVLRRHPAALASLARHHLAACVEGARQGYRTARTELGGALPPHGVDAVLAAYRSEGRRLVAMATAVGLVERALRGETFSPRLRDSSSRPRDSRPGPGPAEPAAGHGEAGHGTARRRGNSPAAVGNGQVTAGNGQAATGNSTAADNSTAAGDGATSRSTAAGEATADGQATAARKKSGPAKGSGRGKGAGHGKPTGQGKRTENGTAGSSGKGRLLAVAGESS